MFYERAVHLPECLEADLSNAEQAVRFQEMFHTTDVCCE